MIPVLICIYWQFLQKHHYRNYNTHDMNFSIAMVVLQVLITARETDAPEAYVLDWILFCQNEH